MLNKKCFGAVLVAAAAVSSATAMADDRGVNTAVGAVLGAAIGHNVSGRNGAIVGGVLGAAVGSSISTRDDRRYNSGYYYDNRGYSSATYYQPAPVYAQPREVYYAQPRAVYYQRPQAVYYEQPRYYRQAEVVVVNPGRGHHHDRGWERHDRGWERHDRDWDRGDRDGRWGYGR